MDKNTVWESENFSLFAVTYESELMKAVKDYPQEYAFPFTSVPVIASKMLHSIVTSIANNRNEYNKDSRAIKATCKRLNIKHTYKAIAAFLEPVGE